MVNDTKNKVSKILLKRNYGLTIEEIAGFLKINRATASKYLAIMEAEGKVLVRCVGKAKLHYLKNKNLNGLK